MLQVARDRLQLQHVASLHAHYIVSFLLRGQMKFHWCFQETLMELCTKHFSIATGSRSLIVPDPLQPPRLALMTLRFAVGSLQWYLQWFRPDQFVKCWSVAACSRKPQAISQNVSGVATAKVKGTEEGFSSVVLCFRDWAEWHLHWCSLYHLGEQRRLGICN